MKREPKRKILKIALTIGDPAGIGSEVTLKALDNIKDGEIIPVVFGRLDVLTAHFPVEIQEYEVITSENDFESLSTDKKYIFDVKFDSSIPMLGEGSIETGAESLKYLDEALRLWKLNLIDAIVTAPVSKSFIEKSGTSFTGHTEYIADYIGESSPVMMMYSEKYRVILASTHLPISEVANYVDGNILESVIRVGNEALTFIDKKNPKIAITGFDPHCGDDGAIGTFDKDITENVVKKLQNEKIYINGPFAADTLFIPDKWEQYDLVIVHYHDQGLIPFKMLAFDTGVNVTLGLSITRTSVDHGTAYDIAGKNIASFTSMVEAIYLAKKIELGKRTT